MKPRIVDPKNYKWMGWKQTDYFFNCPLCMKSVRGIRQGYMRWAYVRCPFCLLAKDTKDWKKLSENRK